MLSRTVTVQTGDQDSPQEHARATAQAIGALLLAVNPEAQVETFRLVFAKLSPEVRGMVRAVLAPED